MKPNNKDVTEYETIETRLNEFSEETKSRILNSKYGYAKIIALELLPVFQGAICGSIGRVTGAEWIPAVPLMMDSIHGATKLSIYARYGMGVALAYYDKIL